MACHTRRKEKIPINFGGKKKKPGSMAGGKGLAKGTGDTPENSRKRGNRRMLPPSVSKGDFQVTAGGERGGKSSPMVRRWGKTQLFLRGGTVPTRKRKVLKGSQKEEGRSI